MTVIAVGSAKGAPGATTTVLAMAAMWPQQRHLLVVEVDPDGGVLAARRGLSAEPGLVGAVAALLRGRTDLSAHTQALGDQVAGIVAPAAVEQTRASLAAGGDALWPALVGDDHDVLLDCGRLTPSSPALAGARAAAATLVVARPRLDDVALLRANVPALRRAGVEPYVVLIDDGPYRPDEVGSTVPAPVIAVLPTDHRTAAALNGDAARHRLSRSRLLRAARQLVAHVLDDRVATADDPDDGRAPAVLR